MNFSKMAKQDGIVPIKGTIGNLTFYKGKEGFQVRSKGGVNASRIANDPAFQRTRENGAEFSRAGKAGKVLRSGLRQLLLNVSDSRMIGRLLKEMMRIIKSDILNPRGSRNVIDGDVTLLQGFEFNANSNLGTTLFAPFSQSIDRATGQLAVNIPAFVPSSMIIAPGGTTHFKITAAAAEVDFFSEVSTVEMNSTGELPWNSVATQPINLVNNLSPNSNKPLFLVLGIQFLQVVNGTVYPLKSGAFNAVAIVGVSKV